MKVRHAIPLALLWLVLLVVGDGWFLIESKVLDAHLQSALAEIFEAPVSFGALSLSPTLDVVFTDVRMMRPDEPGRTYATIDEIRVAPRWSALITSLQPDVKEISVVNPTLVIRWKDDRTFDMPSPLRTDLEARTQTMGELPAILVRGLTLVLENPPAYVRRNGQDIVFDDLEITLAPEGSSRWLYRFGVDVSHGMLGHITGGGAFSKTAFEVHLRHAGLAVTKDLVDILRPDVAEILDDLEVDGDVTLSAEIGPVRGGAGEELTGTIDCEGMAVRSRKWDLVLAGIRGKVEIEGGRLVSPGVTARFEDAAIEVRGVLDLTGASRVLDAQGEIVGLAVTRHLAERIRGLPDPCPNVADQIEAWDPEAFANVSFRLTQDRDESGEPGLVRPAFDVEFKGGSRVRYIGHVGEDGRRHGFAYPLEDLRGLLKFTDVDVVFERLTAMNGSLAVEARGRIDYEHLGDEAYDVDIEANGLMLDERVSDALEASARDLFNNLDAAGVADLTVGIKRFKGEPPGPRVDVAVDLRGVAMSPRMFPLDFADARGIVRIPNVGPIVIEQVLARRGRGGVTVKGRVPREHESGLVLDVAFEKFPVDPALVNALKVPMPDVAETLARLNPVGPVDGNIHVALDPDGALVELGGVVRFDEMTLAPEDPGLRIDDAEGSIGLAPSLITIHSGTTGSIAGERFAVQGSVHVEGGLDITIAADNFRMDHEFLAAIEPVVPWFEDAERPELDGPMSVSLTAKGPPSDPAIAIEADFLGVDVDLGAVRGVRLDGLRGHVSRTLDGAVTLRGVVARIPVPDFLCGDTPCPPDERAGSERTRPPMAFEVASGSWMPSKASDPEAHGVLELAGVSLRGVEWSSELIALLPVGDEGRQALDRLAMAGAIDLSMNRLSWNGHEFVIGRGRLLANGVRVGAERTLEAESFAIERMSVAAGSDHFQLDGDFVTRNVRFMDIPLPMIIGRIEADGGGLRFENIEADLFAYENREGTVFALGKINPEGSRVGITFGDGSFESRLRLLDVNLPAAIRTFGGNPRGVSGSCRSLIDLRGTLGEPATYVGAGDIEIRARNVVSLPVFYRMFNSLDILSIFERNDPWTRVDADFEIRDRVVDTRRIRIDAPDVLLSGPCSLTFDGAVKGDLRANLGMGISPIGWVTRLISHVVFSGVRIEGPISDPRVNAYSLGGG